MTRKAKIISKEALSERFCKLYEYVLQMPSLARDGHSAAIKREVIECSDAVVVLIYAKDTQSFVLCEEYRTGIIFNKTNDDDPLLLQCVAGMIDKDKNPEEIARMEAMEEVGVELSSLTHIASVYSSPGRHTEKTHLYLGEIDKAPEEGLFGLPEEGEEIRSRVISKTDIYHMMDEKKIIDSMTLNALNWFRTQDKEQS